MAPEDKNQRDRKGSSGPVSFTLNLIEDQLSQKAMSQEHNPHAHNHTFHPCFHLSPHLSVDSPQKCNCKNIFMYLFPFNIRSHNIKFQLCKMLLLIGPQEQCLLKNIKHFHIDYLCQDPYKIPGREGGEL